MSFPDVALLERLSAVLGLSIVELVKGRRIPKEKKAFTQKETESVAEELLLVQRAANCNLLQRVSEILVWLSSLSLLAVLLYSYETCQFVWAREIFGRQILIRFQFLAKPLTDPLVGFVTLLLLGVLICGIVCAVKARGFRKQYGLKYEPLAWFRNFR